MINLFIKPGVFRLKSEKVRDMNENLEIYIDYMRQNPDDSDFPYVDHTKKTIAIVDDNEGICSFLKDDIYEILGEDSINYNILTFTTKMAAYDVIKFLESTNIKIDYAILDILLNGIQKTKIRNIKLTGIDLYEYIHFKNPDLACIFYTGNQLNPDVNFVKQMIDQYENISHHNINDIVLYKTSLSIPERQEEIKRLLFGDRT